MISVLSLRFARLDVVSVDSSTAHMPAELKAGLHSEA